MSRHAPRPRGFTLIELLIVVVIVGILTTTVALSLSHAPHAQARAEVQRLAALLEAASSEALAGQRQLAWNATPDGYEFLFAPPAIDHAPHWQPLLEDELFHPRRFEDGLHLRQIEVEGQPLPAGSPLIFRRADPVLFDLRLDTDSSGSTGATSFRLRGLPTGQVTVEELS
ncbi:MAG: type II secretion system protein [Sterolibacterium sp.]|jgi:general secretion pathway protein H|nr:type II secretion system protein [Sterolibacterium sp.]